ncbi:MAG TPA: carboxylate-amine ligase [bacterium]|nr:carboxylate-amine ligase [bacterium]HMZ03995.1 carboxylate-amine ligase [bacterium]HNB10561.1 carboxylate-amine ligase [bacterium]HNB56609.1 carboxylate-amine ligase [bacterium]HNE83349.1 carboxylate-amine ligase [bacterium]
MNKPAFTIGIEEEFQTVDPETRELRSHVSGQMIEEGKLLLSEQIKMEMHQSVVEVGTNICQNITEAKADVIKLRRTIHQLATKRGLGIVAASTHPFSDWKTQPITEHERYKEIVENMGDVARANLIFGLHVHIGMPDNESCIAIQNQIRYFLPHILALSTSSPFWIGRSTGLSSIRTQIFRRFPRTDIPPIFDSWSDFEDYVNLLIQTKCIDNGKRIWWDARPHPSFGTLEVRICDLPTRVDETIAIAALIQALMHTLYRTYKKNMSWRIYPNQLISENKWRASRYGLHGKLIDFGKKEEVPTKELIYELIRFVDDSVEELGSRNEINYIYKILDGGTSSDRQLAVYEQSGRDLKAVVDFLLRDTLEGLY